MHIYNYQWYIYNHKTRNQQKDLDPYTTTQQIYHMPEEEIPFTYVWCEFWQNWQKLEFVSELMALRGTREFLESKETLSAPTLPSDYIKRRHEQEERREYRRSDIRLNILIVAGNMVFRSYSKNISLGGFCLQHRVPEELLVSGSIKAYIYSQNNKQSLCLQPEIVDRGYLVRFSFSNSSPQQLQQLQSWLSDLPNQQAK